MMQVIKLRMEQFFSVKTVAWIVYGSLLLVLLPHTAWAFSLFEGDLHTVFPWWGVDSHPVAWMGAIVFEASIAVLTHKLAGHIESVPNHQDVWKRLRKRYLNAYTVGLLVALAVSGLANTLHAYHYRDTEVIPDQFMWLYIAAFGSVLPVFSFFFAWVLTDLADVGEDPDKLRRVLDTAKKSLANLRQENGNLQKEVTGLRQELTATQYRLDNGVVKLDELPPPLRAYVTEVAAGRHPDDRMENEFGIGLTTISRASNQLLKDWSHNGKDT